MTGSEADKDAASEGRAAPAEDTQRHVEAKLLELLVCPLTKTTLYYDRERQELISRAAGVAYPIRDGVPVMTEDAARPLDPGPKVVSSS